VIPGSESGQNKNFLIRGIILVSLSGTAQNYLEGNLSGRERCSSIMFRNVKLSMKLALGFGLVLVVFVTAVMISWLQIGRVEEDSRFLNKVNDAQHLMSELESDIAKARFEVRDYMYSENLDSLKRAREFLAEAKAHIEEGKSMYASEPRLFALKSLSDMDAPLEQYSQNAEAVASLLEAKQKNLQGLTADSIALLEGLKRVSDLQYQSANLEAEAGDTI